MDAAPDSDPLRRFLSGKRRSERQACDLAVEVRSATTALPGRAIDVSEGGVLVFVEQSTLARLQADVGIIEAMGIVDRHFRNGAQLVFGAESMKLPCSVVRLTPPRGGEGIHLGCRFERALTPDEGASLLATTPPPPLVPLALAPRSGPDMFALLFPGGTVTAGPRYASKVVGLSDADADLRIEPLRPTSPVEITDELSKRRLFVRILRAGERIFEGDVRLASVRPALSRTPGIDVRVTSTEGAFPSALKKRFEKRRR